MAKIFIFVQKIVLCAKTHIHRAFDSGSNPLASIKTGIFLLSIFRPIYFLRVSFGHLVYLIQSNRYCDIQILVFVSCKKKGRILGSTRVRMKNPHILKKKPTNNCNKCHPTNKIFWSVYLEKINNSTISRLLCLRQYFMILLLLSALTRK